MTFPLHRLPPGRIGSAASYPRLSRTMTLRGRQIQNDFLQSPAGGRLTAPQEVPRSPVVLECKECRA